MPSYDKPTCPQPTKHYLIKKKSRGVKDDGALVKLGDVDLAGKVPIRDLLGKVGEGTKKITEAVTDMLGDSLGGLIDNILKEKNSENKPLSRGRSVGGLFGEWRACRSRCSLHGVRVAPFVERVSRAGRTAKGVCGCAL